MSLGNEFFLSVVMEEQGWERSDLSRYGLPTDFEKEEASPVGEFDYLLGEDYGDDGKSKSEQTRVRGKQRRVRSGVLKRSRDG